MAIIDQHELMLDIFNRSQMGTRAAIGGKADLQQRASNLRRRFTPPRQGEPKLTRGSASALWLRLYSLFASSAVTIPTRHLPVPSVQMTRPSITNLLASPGRRDTATLKHSSQHDVVVARPAMTPGGKDLWCESNRLTASLRDHDETP